MEDPTEAGALFTAFVYVVLPAAALLLWWAIGRSQERRHLADLAAREAALRGVLVTTLKGFPGAGEGCPPPELVCGETAIASDGFKTWVFGLRNLFGGESRSFTRLFDRARREAVAKMAEAARARGFDAVCNVRFATADIGGNASGNGGKNKALPMAVCTVSGTAYRRAPSA